MQMYVHAAICSCTSIFMHWFVHAQARSCIKYVHAQVLSCRGTLIYFMYRTFMNMYVHARTSIWTYVFVHFRFRTFLSISLFTFCFFRFFGFSFCFGHFWSLFTFCFCSYCAFFGFMRKTDKNRFFSLKSETNFWVLSVFSLFRFIFFKKSNCVSNFSWI